MHAPESDDGHVILLPWEVRDEWFEGGRPFKLFDRGDGDENQAASPKESNDQIFKPPSIVIDLPTSVEANGT